MLGLHHERCLRECAVVAGVVEVQMAVHHDRDLIGTQAERREARDDRVLFRHDDLETARSERGVGTLDVHRMEPGVEQHVALGRPQQRRPDRREALRLACAGHERRPTDLDAAGAEDQKLDHEWPACTTACPSARAMSHRFTGSARRRQARARSPGSPRSPGRRGARLRAPREGARGSSTQQFFDGSVWIDRALRDACDRGVEARRADAAFELAKQRLAKQGLDLGAGCRAAAVLVLAA